MNNDDWKQKGWISKPTHPGQYEGEISGNPTTAEIDAAYPEYTHLKNEKYSRLMNDYLMCTNVYLHNFGYWQTLEKQLIRRDLDTVCAYELY